MPGGVPTGFRGERIQIGVYKRKKGRTAGEPRIVQRIVPDPEMWDRCYLAWEMRHSGAPYGEIHAATRLFKNINGYDTFFSNSIYIGDLEYGDKVYEGFVPTMIPKAWFDTEQKDRAERAKKRSGKAMNRAMEPRRVGSEYLLSSLVFCGHVDGEKHPHEYRAYSGCKGKWGSYTFFICSTSKNTRATHCQAKRMGMKSLDQTVINNLLSHILTMDNLRPLAVEIARSLEHRSGDTGTRMIALEEKLAEAQKSLENIMDAIEKMGYASHLLNSVMTRASVRKKNYCPNSLS